jgi:uncharacterized membrane protein
MALGPLILTAFGGVLLLFGVVFAELGMTNERAYWSQRDPSGDPAEEATPFRTVFKEARHLAVSEVRAPLRVAAIGVMMCWIGIPLLIIGTLLLVLV